MMDHPLNRYDRHSSIVRLFQLDNEPSGWGNTHRDVMPNSAGYPPSSTSASSMPP
jgi:hypothetical protein